MNFYHCSFVNLIKWLTCKPFFAKTSWISFLWSQAIGCYDYFSMNKMVFKTCFVVFLGECGILVILTWCKGDNCLTYMLSLDPVCNKNTVFVVFQLSCQLFLFHEIVISLAVSNIALVRKLGEMQFIWEFERIILKFVWGIFCT